MNYSIQGRIQSIAFAAAAAIMLVPANLLPVITIHSPSQDRTDTILSSIGGLFDSGLWALGIIVFAASIAVPLLKLWGLVWLLLATRLRPASLDYGGQARPDAARLLQIYNALDFIGRWSMLDVFLVAFLTGVVQFGSVASVHPHMGIFAFAAAVVFTMLATHAFDPRSLTPR